MVTRSQSRRISWVRRVGRAWALCACVALLHRALHVVVSTQRLEVAWTEVMGQISAAHGLGGWWGSGRHSFIRSVVVHRAPHIC